MKSLWVILGLIIGITSSARASASDLEDWISIVGAYAAPLRGQPHIAYPVTYAILPSMSRNIADLQEQPFERTNWYYSPDRLREALGLSKQPSPAVEREIQRLGLVLTVEAIARTVSRFGSESLSPHVGTYFRNHENELAEFTQSLQWIAGRLDAYQPSDWELLERDLNSSLVEGLMARVIEGLFHSWQSKIIDRQLAAKLFALARTRRLEAWDALWVALRTAERSQSLGSSDFAISVLKSGRLGPTCIEFVNLSERQIPRVAVLIANYSRELSGAVQLVQRWKPQTSYWLSAGNQPIRLTVERQSKRTDLHVMLVAEDGVVMDTQLTQLPGNRISGLGTHQKQFFLDTHQPVSELRRLGASNASLKIQRLFEEHLQDSERRLAIVESRMVKSVTGHRATQEQRQEAYRQLFAFRFEGEAAGMLAIDSLRSFQLKQKQFEAALNRIVVEADHSREVKQAAELVREKANKRYGRYLEQ